MIPPRSIAEAELTVIRRPFAWVYVVAVSSLDPMSEDEGLEHAFLELASQLDALGADPAEVLALGDRSSDEGDGEPYFHKEWDEG